MQKTEWVLFDVGGVLLDWRRSSAALADFLEVDHGTLLDTMFTHAPLMNVGTITPQEGWKRILRDLGHDGHDPQETILRWRAKEFWLADTLKLVQELHNAGYRLAVFSNSWLGLSNDPNDSTMPPEMANFSYILDSSKEKMKKPDPAFYELAEQTVGAKGESLFFIDDDQPNLVPAAEKGWLTYHYDMGEDRSGQNANAELRAKLF